MPSRRSRPASTGGPSTTAPAKRSTPSAMRTPRSPRCDSCCSTPPPTAPLKKHSAQTDPRTRQPFPLLTCDERNAPDAHPTLPEGELRTDAAKSDSPAQARVASSVFRPATALVRCPGGTSTCHQNRCLTASSVLLKVGERNSSSCIQFVLRLQPADELNAGGRTSSTQSDPGNPIVQSIPGSPVSSSLLNASSSRTGTPSCSALAALLPGDSPITT